MVLLRRDRKPYDSRGRRTPRPGRRGFTLVEMLVTVAVLVIMMTILVQIFQAATGSVSAAQAYQQLDDQLRRLDGILRADLRGATAHFTPPLDPELNLGYFEYGENEFADNQGEDGDDYVRFTAKAPPGRPFTGRFWPNYWSNANTSQIFTAGGNNLASFPITITSDYAEIIYFVRNGNLYRRVLLIAPELQSSITPTVSHGNLANVAYLPTGGTFNFQPPIFGSQSVSWQGVNDLSAHPSPSGPVSGASLLTQAQGTIVLNTLGHLTNRENRAFYSRFANDFFNANGVAGPDGIPDDLNGDNIPDLYPTLYPTVFANTALINAPAYNLNLITNTGALNALAFPFVFPGAYSKAQTVSTDAYGWIHAPSPVANVNGSFVHYDTNPAAYLQALNHHPVEIGDNLPTPLNPPVGNLAPMLQSWWGFPTWRETLPATWVDPTWQVNVNLAQPLGLNPAEMSVSNGTLVNAGQGGTGTLPPTTSIVGGTDYLGLRFPNNIFSDGAGSSSNFINLGNWGTGTTLWQLSWEDDLIMTGVRSFDVKAFDNALQNYADLGWGDDLRVPGKFTGNNLLPFLAGNPDYSTSGVSYPPLALIQNQYVDYINHSFAHEGRMPPLVHDNRLDAQYPNPNYVNFGSFVPQYPVINASYSSNVGDNSAGIVRLRRVWDSWSTDYSRAPAIGVNTAANGFPAGPPFSPPIYPSYPPPYPAPLRGIQIQVRVVDPTNQRVKQLTIRQDFTDKL